MSFEIDERHALRLAYIRVTGPYPEVIGPGFNRLLAWCQKKNIQGDYYALYWDNPDITPPEALTTDVAVTVTDDVLGDHEVQIQDMSSGMYASKTVRIENHDFEGAWREFFSEIALSEYRYRVPDPCSERYLNDGMADGVWDVELIIPVLPVDSE